MANAATNAKESIEDMVEPLRQKAQSILDDRKDVGAEQFGALARAINLAVDELQDELPVAAAYVREAATKVNNVSTMIRERSIGELLHEANDFARSNAVAFFGISVVAGLTLARFLKSGSPDHSKHGLPPHRSEGQPHPASKAATGSPERFTAVSPRKV